MWKTHWIAQKQHLRLILSRFLYHTQFFYSSFILNLQFFVVVGSNSLVCLFASKWKVSSSHKLNLFKKKNYVFCLKNNIPLLIQDYLYAKAFILQEQTCWNTKSHDVCWNVEFATGNEIIFERNFRLSIWHTAIDFESNLYRWAWLAFVWVCICAKIVAVAPLNPNRQFTKSPWSFGVQQYT